MKKIILTMALLGCFTEESQESTGYNRGGVPTFKYKTAYTQEELDEIQNQYLEETKKYLEGKDINEKVNKYDQTILMVALEGQKTNSVIRYLLDKGADVNVKDSKGATPLHYAFDHHYKFGEDKEFENYLITTIVTKMSKEFLHYSTDAKVLTPLLWAVQFSNDLSPYYLEKILEKEGLDLNLKFREGKTIFDYAFGANTLKILREYKQKQDNN